MVATQASMPKELDFLNASGYSTSSRKFGYLVLPYLLFPQEFHKDTDLLATAYEFGSAIRIDRNILLYVPDEIGKVKLKNAPRLSDTTLASQIALHKERREYLRLQFKKLVPLSNCPEHLGTLLDIFLCALATSKDEILWYFSNLERMSSLSKKPNKGGRTNLDGTITELVWQTWRLDATLRGMKKAIHQLRLERLKTYLASLNVRNSVEDSFSSGRAALAIVGDLESTLVAVAEGTMDLPALKMVEPAWLKVQILASSHGAAIKKASVFAELAGKMDMLMYIVAPLADFEGFMESNHSLKELVFYTNEINEHVEDILAPSSMASDQQRYIIGYANVLIAAPMCAASAFPMEFDHFKVVAGTFIEELFTTVSSRAADLVVEFAGESQKASAAVVKKSIENLKETKKLKKKKQETTPGASVSTAEQERLWQLRTAMHALVTSLNQKEQVQVYDLAYRPTGFLIRAITTRVTSHVNALVYKSTSPVNLIGGDRKDPLLKDVDTTIPFDILRPSVLLKSIKDILSILDGLEQK
ncbi:Nck-associated protein 1-like, partial [Gonapodya sp. JEL0774]